MGCSCSCINASSSNEEESVATVPYGLERLSHPTPTIPTNMPNAPQPVFHQAYYQASVQRQPSKTILVEGSVSAPSALHNDSQTASINQTGLSTPFDVVTENLPSPYPKTFVSIDFGAAHSAVSYVISSPALGEARQILAWPGSSASFSKIPTCVVYDALGDIRAWGLEATDISLKKNWVRCEWFKPWLHPSSAPSSILESRSFQPPKSVVDVVADYLSCLWTHTKSQIHREHGPSSLSHAEVYLTVPSLWDLRASLLLREAAVKAGLVVQDPESEDIYWEDRLHIIPETEASVIHSVLSSAFKFQPDQSLTICDAGGATVDLATYNVLGALGAPEIAEAAPRSGCYCGSLFLDLRFRELVQARLAAHPVHLDDASLAHFVRSFSRSEKLAYKGAEDDTKLFRFRCLHGEDLDDPAVGLDQGELVIPGDVLRREVFDPVVEQILYSIATHVEASNVRLGVLLLVGGFSRNEYLFQHVTEQFSSSAVSIVRLADGDIASCRGGAQSGIGSLIPSVIQPLNVFRCVTLPAELEDETMRPVYITNVAGRWFCERRVEYIARKGGSVMKGSRSELRLRKFCSSRYDRTFKVVLYASDCDQPKRYFDQEEGVELCRCRVDLATYPSFLEQVEASPFGNFHVDFILGFEMDSAEIRCVLLYKGAKCGSVTCHPRNYHTPPL